MSKRDQKRQAYSSMFVPPVQQAQPKVIKSDQKVCGRCEKYSESAYSSDGRGSCSILKLGSNINVSPPIYNMEGKGGYLTKTLADATSCEHYEKMEMIDKDGYECSDPAYRRSIRQLQ